MGSLVTRVLTAAGIVLVVFLGLTVVALDIAFRSASERAVRDRLQVHVHALLGALEVDETGRAWMPEVLPEPRFSHPGSGLYAQIRDGDGELVWRSPSAVGLRAGRVTPTEPGVTVFDRIDLEDGTRLFRYRFSVVWDTGENGDASRTYHVNVAESMETYRAQLSRYRTNLLGWFGLLLLALIIAQLLILKRMLEPLRRLAEEVGDVEAGRKDLVGDGYPVELSALARNLNALIRNERGNLDRYRNTVNDLAHSLKTPLAVVSVSIEEPPGERRDATIARQVARMDEVIRYQLRRSAAVGSETFGRALPVAPMIEELADSMRKVHATRGVDIEEAVDEAAVFRGSRGDFLEMVGNLLDNACKWSRTRVRVLVVVVEDVLKLVVEDDGPGVPESQRAAVIERGIRGDESVDGHGIGLAIVQDLVVRHGGSLTLDDSPLGGLRATLTLPA